MEEVDSLKHIIEDIQWYMENAAEEDELPFLNNIKERLEHINGTLEFLWED